jgi:non-homologous end joining protein Ku
MRAKNKVALSRLVISGRERLVLISCRDKGFLVSTLRWADEVRNSQLYFDEISEKPIDPEMMALANSSTRKSARSLRANSPTATRRLSWKSSGRRCRDRNPSSPRLPSAAGSST